ncbi:MAG: hypothetical protein CMJ48_01480 [Planctomycetaceae bacterium]|nr:hypothetical protein [Planctomycetaceae bacterium]
MQPVLTGHQQQFAAVVALVVGITEEVRPRLIRFADPLDLPRVAIHGDGAGVLVFVSDDEPRAVLCLIHEWRAVVGEGELVLAKFLEGLHVKSDDAGESVRPCDARSSRVIVGREISDAVNDDAPLRVPVESRGRSRIEPRHGSSLPRGRVVCMERPRHGKREWHQQRRKAKEAARRRLQSAQHRVFHRDAPKLVSQKGPSLYEAHPHKPTTSHGKQRNELAMTASLAERATKQPIPIVAGYDEFSARSFPAYPGSTSRQRWHRQLLRKTMPAAGFEIYEYEWWHFDYQDWKQYPIPNKTFEELETTAAAQ